MKKKTTKKAKAKTTPRSKSATKNSPLSKLKKSNNSSNIQRTGKDSAPPRKVALTVESGKKTVESTGSAARAKLASQNGRQPAVDEKPASKKSKTDRIQASVGPSEEPKKPSPPPPPEPVVKTYLSTKELKEFKALLLAKRAELAGDVENLTTHALNRKSGGVSDQSSMPIHMADLGSDTWEQDFTLGLIANEQAVVREIDESLERIENRTYGICAATDKPISRERLLAKPWAKYCIEYARLREEGRAP